MSRLIALLTDFGGGDVYAGVMKGVILSRCPGARIVDLSHGVPPQDLRAGAFALMNAAPFFPEGTLFVCVVDPAVGSRRRIVWARSGRHEFLAPDNGVLSWAARVQPLRETRAVRNSELFLRPLSRTFHGRDIFAPVAAARASGLAPVRLGPRCSGLVRLPFPTPRRTARGLRGEVLSVDRFGNAVTNLRPLVLGRGARIWAGGQGLGPLRNNYASAPRGKALAIEGSHGFVELSVREGSFAEKFDVSAGEPVYVR